MGRDKEFKEELRDLSWFDTKYSDETAKYWAISDYLYEGLDGNVCISKTIKDELLEFIRQYVIKRFGVDPKTVIIPPLP